MTIFYVTVNNERFPVPTHSEDIWNERKVAGTRGISPDLFHLLMEDTGQSDEEGRPVFNLSSKVAYNYDALMANERPRAHHNPVLAAYKKFIDANPNTFIRLNELGDDNYKPTQGLKLLYGQWVIFKKPEPEFLQPTLCAMASRDGRIYLPGRTISSLTDLDELHKSYAVMYHAPRFGGAYNIQVLFQEADLEVARQRGLNVENLKHPLLAHVQANELGFQDKGLVLRDSQGTSRIIPGTVMRDDGMIRLIQFGLVDIKTPNASVGFFGDVQKGASLILLGSAALIANGQNYSEQIYAIAHTLHTSGAWESGPRAFAKRMTRWAISRVKQAFRPGNGD